MRVLGQTFFSTARLLILLPAEAGDEQLLPDISVNQEDGPAMGRTRAKCSPGTSYPTHLLKHENLSQFAQSEMKPAEIRTGINGRMMRR